MTVSCGCHVWPCSEAASALNTCALCSSTRPYPGGCTDAADPTHIPNLGRVSTPRPHEHTWPVLLPLISANSIFRRIYPGHFFPPISSIFFVPLCSLSFSHCLCFLSLFSLFQSVPLPRPKSKGCLLSWFHAALSVCLSTSKNTIFPRKKEEKIEIKREREREREKRWREMKEDERRVGDERTAEKLRRWGS